MQNSSYYLPPEWAPQSGVMLTWPHIHGDWAPYLHTVEPIYTLLTRHISMKEKVVIACYDATHLLHVQKLLRDFGCNMEAIKLYIASSNDSWTRDHGPITVYTEKNDPLLLDFTFNGWGQKFEAELDNQITQKLHGQNAFINVSIKTIPFVLEGGSIEVNGAGILLTTQHCLLAPTRNPHLNISEIEQILSELFGIKKILWLEQGHLEGDDTDSHIDTLARFINVNTIAYVHCDDPADPHYSDLLAMKNQLEKFTDLNGQPFQLVPLPWPHKKFNAQGKRLPATYANFLIINHAVLLPTYHDPNDEKALLQLQRHFPNHAVIGIPCLPLIEQFGSLHCITMQLPHTVLSNGGSLPCLKSCPNV